MSVIENLERQYPGFEISIPKWELADDGITALIGPSGSGKTTIFRLLIGLESCPKLSWKFNGENLAQLNAPERNLGVVFQSLELFPHMSAKENILFATRARGIEASVAKERIEELVKDLRLEACLERSAALLSGGEAQRVALARAVIARPRFLFLDEPFSALDSELRAEARALVKKVIHRLEIPTLLITHDKDDITALAQNVVNIQNGRLV